MLTWCVCVRVSAVLLYVACVGCVVRRKALCSHIPTPTAQAAGGTRPRQGLGRRCLSTGGVKYAGESKVVACVSRHMAMLKIKINKQTLLFASSCTTFSSPRLPARAGSTPQE